MKNADVGRVYMLYARRTSIQRDRQRVEVGQAGRDIPSSPLRRLAPGQMRDPDRLVLQ